MGESFSQGKNNYGLHSAPTWSYRKYKWGEDLVYLNVEMNYNLSKNVHVLVKLFDFANPLVMSTSYIYESKGIFFLRQKIGYIIDHKDGI